MSVLVIAAGKLTRIEAAPAWLQLGENRGGPECLS